MTASSSHAHCWHAPSQCTHSSVHRSVLTDSHHRAHLVRVLMAQVRGAGLMIGVEFVRDRDTREPFPGLAKHVMSHMRANRVLVSVDGPHSSVIKLKPPMVLTTDDMDTMVDALDAALHAFPSSEARVRFWRSDRQPSN